MAATELDELIARFDLSDPAFIADPYPVLRALREATPIFVHPVTGQWTLTRFDDVHRLLRDRRVGRIYTHRWTHEEFGRPEPDARWADFEESERASLLNLEPPDHTRIRSLVTKVFTPKAVAALRPAIEATAGPLLDACRARGAFDLITDYAQPYSISVICNLLGVPVADGPQLLRWSHAIVKMYEFTTTDGKKAEANAAARAFIDYVHTVIAAKRARPDDSLVSQLVQVEESGDRLTEDEIVSTTIVLLNAGHEATVNVMGNGMRAFMKHPDQWRRMTSGEVDPRTAVEEMTRWDAPLHLFERWVLEPEGIELCGEQIPFGSEVAMLFGSANRDDRRFPDADRFDAGRGDAGHIGFGGGTHFCIGAPLARLEIEVSVQELLARMPALSLDEEPSYAPTFVLRGLQGLRLTVG